MLHSWFLHGIGFLEVKVIGSVWVPVYHLVLGSSQQQLRVGVVGQRGDLSLRGLQLVDVEILVAQLVIVVH